MNKLFVMTTVCSALVLAGCSSVVKDHGLDYQTAESNEKTLVVPEGAEPVKDRLVIPNESNVADLEASGEFEAPRAPFLYQPLADVSFSLLGDQATMTVPTDINRTKALFKSYLATLATEEEPETIETDEGDVLISKPIQLEKQGFWARTWSSITRLYPEKYQYKASFSETGNGTDVAFQVLVHKDGEQTVAELNDDQAPTSMALNSWYHVAKKISEDSVLLSDQGRDDLTRSTVWVNQRGEYAYFLGKNFDPATVDNFVSAQMDFYVVEDDAGVKSLSMIPSDEVPRVGDVVPLTVPMRDQDGTTKEMKLFNVYRRDLDDVEWTHRTYPYQVIKQQEGYFLKVDTSAVEFPRLVSYRILSMFE
ncbi:hypothetical protein ACFQ45_11600 [Rhodanobacter aciditrophus]|uniref:Lipoprotein n=1 Tax=Rhodanobacter aciditrophus TaxID=1623218 RepID=A0ABW4B3D0_9GAMM